MKKLKTTFTVLMVVGTLLLAAGAVSASGLDGTDQPPVSTYVVVDPGTGGGGK